MFVKLFVFAALVGIVVCNVTPDYYVSTFNKYPGANYEYSCQSVGGICMEASECPDGKQSTIRGLCNYKGKGAVCCHSLPKSETRCHKRGGECVPISNRCPDNLTFKAATDCSKNEKCCMLVN